MVAHIRHIGDPHATVHLKLSLDPRGLTLRSQGGGSAVKIERMFAEMDARGAILVEGQHSKLLVVPANSHDIYWEQALPLIPGGGKVRVIVRDGATGKVGTLTLPVDDLR